MDDKASFQKLIDTSTDEPRLQEFLTRNPWLIDAAFHQGAHYSTVFPKFRLAGDLIPDFVMIGHRSVWSWDVDLIEIEPSVLDRPLFNKHLQPAGRLRDAESQIMQWQGWMHINEDFFVRTALAALRGRGAWDERPEFYELSDSNRQDFQVWYRIVVGRRADFDDYGDTYRQLRWRQSGHRVEIMPWDRFTDLDSAWQRFSTE